MIRTCTILITLLAGIALTQTVPNCHFSFGKKCVKCDTGYKVEDGVCIAISLPNCAIASPFTHTCSFCDIKFYLSAGQCLPQSVANCELNHPNINRCKECKTGYAVTTVGTCAAQAVANCKEHMPNRQQCTECNPNFVLVNGACKAKPANCVDNDTKGMCIECKPGYYLDKGACVAQNIDNCMTYEEQKNLCTECKSGFALTKNMCVPPPANCVKPNSSGFTCDTCAPGFYLEKLTRQCKAGTVTDCKKYKTNTDTCLKCNEPKIIITADNKCSDKLIQGCIGYSATLTCDTCAINRYPSANGASCPLQSIANCQGYKRNKNECVNCGPKSIFVDPFTCVLQDVDKCVTYVDKSSDCAICETGYYLDPNNAQSCLPQNVDGCITYNDNVNTCQTCDLGKFPSGDPVGSSCDNQSLPNCLTYTPNENTCTGCDYDYLVNPSKQCDSHSLPMCMRTLNGVCRQCNLDHMPSDETNSTCVLHNAFQLELQMPDGSWVFLDYTGTGGVYPTFSNPADPGLLGRYIKITIEGTHYKLATGDDTHFFSDEDDGTTAWNCCNHDAVIVQLDPINPDHWYFESNWVGGFLREWGILGDNDITLARPIRRTYLLSG